MQKWWHNFVRERERDSIGNMTSGELSFQIIILFELLLWKKEMFEILWHNTPGNLRFFNVCSIPFCNKIAFSKTKNFLFTSWCAYLKNVWSPNKYIHWYIILS